MRKRSTYIKPRSVARDVINDVLAFTVAILTIPILVVFFVMVMP